MVDAQQAEPLREPQEVIGRAQSGELSKQRWVVLDRPMQTDLTAVPNDRRIAAWRIEDAISSLIDLPFEINLDRLGHCGEAFTGITENISITSLRRPSTGDITGGSHWK